ncbi:MAG TPA: adenylate/guanylate cyclase domain-containing protein, partial [Vicinamibacteria bacterium]|nr:adenylate/guanylate cyclase domain-containing protein [Vicinamibacteria bacterium]
MPALPSGATTFLFTDIEGSTPLWEQHPEAMRDVLARHDLLLRRAIDAHGGAVFKTVGDAFYAAFDEAAAGIAAALAAQRALREIALSLPDAGGAHARGAMPVRVRMALSTGAAEARDGDYFGPPLNRVARLLAAAHGGQILVSAATAELLHGWPVAGTELRDLGEHRLRGLDASERVFQLVVPDLPADFPPLNTL